MLDPVSIVPFAVVSSAVTWAAQAWGYARKRKIETNEQSDRLEIHRDQFTLELLQNARTEIALVRCEINELREEQSTLRKLEQHVYHFQESLDHLERVLFASDDDFAQAKRNATAFLNRMRRLQEIKGTTLNEAQILESEKSLSTQNLNGAVTGIDANGKLTR